MPISVINERLETDIGVPSAQQCLKKNGQALSPELTIESAGLAHGDMVVLEVHADVVDALQKLCNNMPQLNKKELLSRRVISEDGSVQSTAAAAVSSALKHRNENDLTSPEQLGDVPKSPEPMDTNTNLLQENKESLKESESASDDLFDFVEHEDLMDDDTRRRHILSQQEREYYESLRIDQEKERVRRQQERDKLPAEAKTGRVQPRIESAEREVAGSPLKQAGGAVVGSNSRNTGQTECMVDGQLLSDYMQDLTKDDNDIARKLYEAENGLPYPDTFMEQSPFLCTQMGPLGNGSVVNDFLHQTSTNRHDSAVQETMGDTDSCDEDQIAAAIRLSIEESINNFRPVNDSLGQSGDVENLMTVDGKGQNTPRARVSSAGRRKSKKNKKGGEKKDVKLASQDVSSIDQAHYKKNGRRRADRQRRERDRSPKSSSENASLDRSKNPRGRGRNRPRSNRNQSASKGLDEDSQILDAIARAESGLSAYKTTSDPPRSSDYVTEWSPIISPRKCGETVGLSDFLLDRDDVNIENQSRQRDHPMTEDDELEFAKRLSLLDLDD